MLAPAPNSGTLVLPTTIAPAARHAATMRSSFAGTWSFQIGEPQVVRRPSVSLRSFTPSGRPSSTPSASPRRMRASEARASSRARS